MASLLLNERHLEVGPDGATLGRRSDNDVVLESHHASRHHAKIELVDGHFRLIDLGSANGTYLNGERLENEARTLRNGDSIVVGTETVRFLHSGDGAAVQRSIQLSENRLGIGRDPSNDLVLSDPSVSRFHAEVRRRNGSIELRDLDSSNGTRVDGRLVHTAVISPGTEIGLGSHRLIFDGDGFIARDDHGGLRIDAQRISFRAGERLILNAVSLAIQPGELTAIIGESGAGKSTLLKALAGVTEPSEGTVRINGDPVRTRLTDLGYVPQDDIVHRRLTVVEALRYSARLRLPQDSRASDVEEAVARVLAELGLTEHAAKRVDQLSGGQRKRVGVAIELLDRPGLLFLDEPTTGLDPGLEARSMQLFRRLADNRRAVILVTHATRSLGLCDRLIVIGEGGLLCFDGPPAAARSFFGVEHYDEIYTRLEEQSAAALRRRFEGGAPRDTSTQTLPPAPSSDIRPPRRSALPQITVLIDRYVRLLWRDTRNLLILTLQVPLLALAIVSLFGTDVFDRSGGNAQQAIQLFFLVVTTATWFGAIDAAREVIKERSVLERERSAGLRLSSYLASKALVLLTLAAGQTVVMAALVFAFRPLDESSGVALGVIVILVFAAWVAVGVGLLISALVSTEDQATSFIPLALLPQLLFAGALVPTDAMGRVAELLSNAAFARWAVAGIGTELDMNARITADPTFAAVSGYGKDFFTLELSHALAILAAFLGGMLMLTWLRLRRP